MNPFNFIVNLTADIKFDTAKETTWKVTPGGTKEVSVLNEDGSPKTQTVDGKEVPVTQTFVQVESQLHQSTVDGYIEAYAQLWLTPEQLNSLIEQFDFASGNPTINITALNQFLIAAGYHLNVLSQVKSA